MGTTIYDIFDGIYDYNGDLNKDLKHYSNEGKKNLVEQLEKIAKDARELIRNEESKYPDEELYTIEEAAKYWRVSKQTVYNKIKSGEIKSVKNGRNIRISRNDLGKYFHFSINDIKNVIICKRNHELKDENNNLIYSFKSNSFYNLVYSGEFIVILYDLETENKIIIRSEHFKKEFRQANEIERDANKYNM